MGCVTSASIGSDMPEIQVVFTGCHTIARPYGRAVTQLSGLTAASDTNASRWFWLLSDETDNLYRMDNHGSIGANDQGNAIDLGGDGEDLEGVVYKDGVLFAVQEGEYTVVEFASDSEEPVDVKTYDIERLACSDENGDAELCTYIEESSANDGLEGITFGNGKFYLLKEKNPGLLIEVNESLDQIEGFTLLNCGSYEEPCPDEHPFPDEVDDDSMDFSGLSYDTVSNGVWIVSDTAAAVFLFDPVTHTFGTFPLVVESSDRCSIIPQGSDLCIEQAEGVAYVEADLLRVVNDRQDANLAVVYEFEIRRE